MAEGSLIDDDIALHALGDAIAVTPWLGLAAELNAARTYRPRVCLIQLNVAGRLFALDPLAFEGRRPNPVQAALCRAPERAPLVVHGGEYTLAALQRDLNLAFPNVIDTQQAALLLGLPATGLRALVSELCGVILPAPISVDWLQRPLAPPYVARALQDVAHLGTLYEDLVARIRAHDLEDELALASRPAPPRAFVTPDTPDPRRYRRLPGAAGLAPEGLRLLEALVRFRDMKARELDLPPGRLLPNAQLVDLAHAPERALSRLSAMRFHTRLVHADLEALRRVVALALATEPSPPAPSPRPAQVTTTPRKGPPTPAIKARLSRLKAWRRHEAAARGVGLQAILPGAALEHLAWFPQTPLADLPELGRRRLERYGDTLTALLRP